MQQLAIETPSYTCPMPQKDVSRWYASPQAMMDLTSGGCDPNSTTVALVRTLSFDGVPSMACIPYYGNNCTTCQRSTLHAKLRENDKCNTESIFVHEKCYDQRPIPFTIRIKNLRRIVGETNMKRELSAFGPIVAMMTMLRKDNKFASWTLVEQDEL
jgi:hypothetical protein